MTGRINVIWDRSGIGLGEDVAVNTFHLSGTLTGPDVTAFSDRFVTLWPGLAPRIGNNYVVDRITGYNESTPPNTPVGEENVNLVGTGTASCLPPQVAVTVTERTTERRYWGRIYIPGFTSNNLTDEGRIEASIVAATANWAEDLWQNFAGTPTKEFVVFSRLGAVERLINRIQVDDVFDIQRRRRFRGPSVKEERLV